MLPIGILLLSVRVGGLSVRIRSGLSIRIRGRLSVRIRSGLPIRIRSGLPVRIGGRLSVRIGGRLSVGCDTSDIRRLCSVRLSLPLIGVSSAWALLNNDELRRVSAGGDEAAPHPPAEEEGNGNVATGLKVSGLAVSGNGKHVDDPCQDNEDDVDDGANRERS